MGPYNYSDYYNKICKELLLDHIEKADGSNMIMSPLSIVSMLQIAADSVSGETKEELFRYINGYPDMKYNLKDLYKLMQYTRELKSVNGVIIAEKIKENIKEDYIASVKEKHDAEVFSSDDIVKDVNKWVSEKTEGMIDSIADESMKEMLLALINAISFMADWEEQYEESDIYSGEFNNQDGSIAKVKMMSSTEYSYIENDFFTGFTKDYKNKNYCFMALLPKKKRSITFLKRAINGSELVKIFQNAQDIEVHVSIPEFKSEFSENLNSFLKRNGVNKIFTNSAEFDPISEEVPLKMDSILHKAYIEVDRRGTKAAAVTWGWVVEAGCAPVKEYKTVRLDRPFVYAIVNKLTGYPVFFGTVNNL